MLPLYLLEGAPQAAEVQRQQQGFPASCFFLGGVFSVCTLNEPTPKALPNPYPSAPLDTTIRIYSVQAT